MLNQLYKKSFGKLVKWYRDKNGNGESMIYVKIKNGSIASVKCENTYHTRADSNVKMIIDALNILPWQPINKNFRIHTGDFPEEGIKENTYYYSCDSEKDNGKLFPDFVFDCWPQVGIENYDKLTERIEERGNEPYLHSKLLWIGNASQHPNRQKFIDIANNNSDIIEGINTAVTEHLFEGKKQKFISLEDHTQYKYLLDLEGRGYSGRIAMLLFTNRMLFLQERTWKQYYYYDLKPYEHFIPVKNDLSDLLDQIRFVEDQGEIYYSNICKQALYFANNNLKYRHIVSYIRKNILEY